ncbi:MAG: diacylglycerol kinase family lipid kinase [Alphaproteobacteria bacterium]|nr:diacylglycerol kinase family lipid kinase [Rhizobiaceae bacterium]MBC7148125.1 diacylglycerol kinase family lipid kinase [Rhizobium sp.]MBU3961206.1 diacylglycerol kinase family lipid kinase [Alphaproteobacteria bacterium]MBU4050571.1 diacylglycerol kinase family lipid kinase [Alphaproteobacteria bacterium]MBU4090930.1 diacylglycerol kinase family lipid kinase [Alphaproteobacteria bacterium]
MKLKAVFNRDGGTFKTTDMDAYCARAEEIFASAGHDISFSVVAGRDVVERLEAASREEGVEALIAGGGDGTISAAAGIAWRAGIPLGVIPAGTMNLFARSLKLPLDINAVLETLAEGRVQAVDIATVNDRPFVHQFSAGLHARLVCMRNAMNFASRLGKMRASTRAAFGVMLRPSRFEVVFDIDHDGRNEHRVVSAISVSNNPFGENPLFFADDLTTGKLGVYLADSLKPIGVAKLAFDILRGRLKDNEAVSATTAEVVRLHFPKRRHGALCVVDGELIRMPRNVEIRLHAGELKVLVPGPEPVTA